MIFHDLPRAAGDTFMHLLENLYGKSLIHIGDNLAFDSQISDLSNVDSDLYEQIANSENIIINKYAIPIHKFPGKHTNIGFVRHPADWYISAYFWAKNNYNINSLEYYGSLIAHKNLDLFGFIRELHSIGHDNIQTKHYFRLFNKHDTHNRLLPEQYKVNNAKFNLLESLIEENFISLAPTNRFDDFLILLVNQFGLPILPYWQVKSSGKWQSSEMDNYDEICEFVLKNSTSDFKLYDYADTFTDFQLNKIDHKERKYINDYKLSRKNADSSVYTFPANKTFNKFFCNSKVLGDLELDDWDYVRNKTNEHGCTLLYNDFIYTIVKIRDTYYVLNNLLFNGFDSLTDTNFQSSVLLNDTSYDCVFNRLNSTFPVVLISFEDYNFFRFENKYYIYRNIDNIIFDPSEFVAHKNLGLSFGSKVYSTDDLHKLKTFFEFFHDKFKRDIFNEYFPINSNYSPITSVTMLSNVLNNKLETIISRIDNTPQQLYDFFEYNIVFYKNMYCAVKFGAGTIEQAEISGDFDIFKTSASLYQLITTIASERCNFLKNVPPKQIDNEHACNIYFLGDKHYLIPGNLNLLNTTTDDFLNDPQVLYATRLSDLVDQISFNSTSNSSPAIHVESRFSRISNDLVSDNVTGLQWFADGSVPDLDGLVGGRKPWSGPFVEHPSWLPEIRTGCFVPPLDDSYKSIPPTFPIFDYVNRMNALCIGGFNDWRVPNINELSSLINDSIESNQFWLMDNGFKNIPTHCNYWSSTTFAAHPDQAWHVHFTNSANVHTSHKSWCAHYILPVRGLSQGIKPVYATGQTNIYSANIMPSIDNSILNGQDGYYKMGAKSGPKRFIAFDSDHAVKFIFDKLTGLTWLSKVNRACHHWDDNQFFLDLVTDFCGHSFWRIPTRDEFRSIVNYNEPDPTVWLNSVAGFDISNQEYWTANACANDLTTHRWTFSFVNGLYPRALNTSKAGFMAVTNYYTEENCEKLNIL